MKFTETYMTFTILGPVVQEAAIVVVDTLVVWAGPLQFTKRCRRGTTCDGSS
jgi:hypothetical protein